MYSDPEDSAMAKSEEVDYLLALWAKSICPYCGKQIPEGQRVGSGKKSEGGFCSLTCYAKFYELELSEKVKLLRVRSAGTI